MKITNHALLRHMQRQLGIDVEAIREDLVSWFDSPGVNRLLEFAAGARCKITVNGVTACFQGGVMTTCYPKQSR